MKIHIRKACRENLVPLLGLRVKKTQEHLMEPNADWLAEAFHIDDSETFGIYAAEVPVGLVSWIDPRLTVKKSEPHENPPADMLYIWRLMIDHQHQGKGYAREIIEIFKQAASLRGLSGLALTTMDKHSHNALDFYIKAGFEPTGRRLNDEIELVLSIR